MSAARRAPADLDLRLPGPDDVRALAALTAEPDWLVADRVEAAGRIAELPIEPNRLYTGYVDFRTADLGAVEPIGPARPGVVATATLPDGADGVIELVEDGVAAVALSAAATKAGLELLPLGDAVRSSALARRLVEGGPLLPADERLAALARAGWTRGVWVRAPKGAQLEKPIVIRWAVGAPGRALSSRTVVSLGTGASISILEELEGSPAGSAAGASGSAAQTAFGGTLEIDLEAGSSLRLASIQDLPGNVVAFQHRFARIGDGASLTWALAQLGGRLVRSRVDNRLVGDGSSVEQMEILFGGGDQLFDLTSYTRHVGRDTTGNILSKGALQDESRTYLKGLITIEKSAVGTDSFLGEFGMNLSKESRSVAIPSLEIDQPDCRRAAHSSSVGPIDETQLFYLESRGIPRDEARKFIVLGFLEPVVARVPLDDVQERLRGLLESKWAAGRRSAVA